MGMQESLKKGTEGECIAWHFFNTKGYVRSVWDVRLDKGFQSEDVDFLVEKTDRQIVKVEVKTDSMADRTKNIAYEVISNKHYNTIGCFEKTKSDWMFYYMPNIHKALIIDVAGLRSEAHSGKYEQQPMGDNALGYLIPIKTLLEQSIAKIYGV